MNKSKLLYFKDIFSVTVPSQGLFNDDIVAISGKTMHLGHSSSTLKRECNTVLPERSASGKVLTCSLLILKLFTSAFIQMILLNQFY